MLIVPIFKPPIHILSQNLDKINRYRRKSRKEKMRDKPSVMGRATKKSKNSCPYFRMNLCTTYRFRCAEPARRGQATSIPHFSSKTMRRSGKPLPWNHTLLPKNHKLLRPDPKSLRKNGESLHRNHIMLHKNHESLRQDPETLRRNSETHRRVHKPLRTNHKLLRKAPGTWRRKNDLLHR